MIFVDGPGEKRSADCNPVRWREHLFKNLPIRAHRQPLHAAFVGKAARHLGDDLVLLGLRPRGGKFAADLICRLDECLFNRILLNLYILLPRQPRHAILLHKPLPSRGINRHGQRRGRRNRSAREARWWCLVESSGAKRHRGRQRAVGRLARTSHLVWTPLRPASRPFPGRDLAEIRLHADRRSSNPMDPHLCCEPALRMRRRGRNTCAGRRRGCCKRVPQVRWR